MLIDILDSDFFRDLTDAECVAAFDEDVELNRDSSSYNLKALGAKLREFGLTDLQLATWYSSIDGLLGADLFKGMLLSDGIDFSDESMRNQIQFAISQTEDETAEVMLSACLDIGISTGKRYAYYGLDSLPTEEEIATARTSISNMIEVATLFNEVLNPMLANQSALSLSEIKAAVAAWGE